MEDRRTEALYLEMTDLSASEYGRARMPEVLAQEHVLAGTLWRNECPRREEYPRTIPEFETLAVYEAEVGFAPAPAPDLVRPLYFRRFPRPAQGRLGAGPTLGLEIVLVSPKTPGGVAALRDWADFVHIHEIAAAAVPGLTMITPYENATGGEPRFLHLYEMDTKEAEATFKEMAPRTVARLQPRGKQAVKAWMGHPELRIDYVNSFTRVPAPGS